ncbi:MAG: hypothetical protein VYE68_05535, partial [Acidobacteriota bacterium]|nr:hypothetical protein [Acidobacteriota bacterium]
HPIMRATPELAPVIAQSHFRQTTTLTVGSGAVAMSFEDGSPALVEHVIGDGRVLVFGSDLGMAWNELPRGVAFVPWLHEVVRYLAGGRSQTRELLVGRGSALASDTPGPDGEGRVVNVDTRESDPTALSSDAFEERARRVVAGPATGDRRESKPTDADQRLWRVAFMLLAVVLVVEGLVAGRSH